MMKAAAMAAATNIATTAIAKTIFLSIFSPIEQLSNRAVFLKNNYKYSVLCFSYVNFF